MRDYRTSCAICDSGEALFELFHRETSLSTRNGHVFQSYISRAFDNVCFLCDNEKARTKQESRMGIELQLDREEKNDLFNAVRNRKSTRSFTDKAINFETLSKLLYFSYCFYESGHGSVPSAGGNYPIKLILMVNNVDGLASGLYEYEHRNGSLIPLNLNNLEILYENMTQSLSLCVNAAFSIHFIGSCELMCYKYQDRGYRFMNIECGHIAQNLLLVSEVLRIGAVCSGGFMDGEFIDYLNKNTFKDYERFLCLYEMFFGIRNEDEN